MEFRNYREEDYEALCDFLIELNRDDKKRINWNWARFEWMYEHPEFDKSLKGSIGLWTEDEKIVGAAIYDMYFGECFCAALPGYEALYPEILDYAYKELKDDSGLGIAICDDCAREIAAAEKAGFEKAEQTENMMSISLDREFSVDMPEGLKIVSPHPVNDAYDIQWLFWQGFDHGDDRAEFESQEEVTPQTRVHFDRFLNVAAENAAGEKVSYCCLWYSDKTEYAYVEPICTVPAYRGKGVAKALIYEALNRVRSLGAKKAYVLSDMEFYEKLGFKTEKHFTFYWKK